MRNLSLGLLGFPIEHSLSPTLHHAALAAARLEGEYLLYSVVPDNSEEEISLLLNRLRRGEIHGLNVTIPYKQRILPLLSNLTPTAQAIGAVNTVYMKEGRLEGENTDAPGFLAALQSAIPPSPHQLKRALVLGAGGAARAVCYALTSAGWQVQVSARRPAQALELIAAIRANLPAAAINFIEYPVGSSLISQAQFEVLVNATPVGMSSSFLQSPWPSGLHLPASALVYDLVYNPPETKLIREARQQGLIAVNGLEMLIEQAALSFECWTGLSASRPAMRAALNTD